MHTIKPNHKVPLNCPYKRKKKHAGTEAAVRYVEDVSVPLPGKKTVSKRNLNPGNVYLRGFP